MKLGKYELSLLETGTFGLDGGAMFGIIPKPLWEKTNPPDGSNRIKLASRAILLHNKKRRIIIDTGMGDKWDAKSRLIYDIRHADGSLLNSLSRFGYTPDDITDVILTHLHFDHAGGSTKYSEGRTVPAFPNAEYFVQKGNYFWADNPSERDRGSYRKDSFEVLMEEGVLKFIDGDRQFDDEIDLIVFNGHTFGQQLVKLTDGNNTMVFCGDLIPTSSHIPVPYVMGYDLQPLITVKEKKELLSSALSGDWILIFQHDPVIQGCTLKSGEKGISIKEKFTAFGSE